MWQSGPDRPDVAHDVQLPERIPLLVGHLLEAGLPREADIVDEDVETAQLTNRLLHERRRGRWLGEVGDDVQRLADPRFCAPAARDHARAFFCEQAGDLASDAAGG